MPKSQKFILTFLLYICSLNLFSIGSKVTWEEFNWKILKSEHFDVYYPEGYLALARIAMIQAEEANIMLSKKLSHNLSQVIPVVVYPSHSHFQMTNIIYSLLDEGIGGFTERIKKRVVVPFLGSYDAFRHVVTHELVHAFQYDILLGGGFGGFFASQYASNPPLWLVEGMAEYLSIGWDETAERTMRDAILTDTLPSIQDLNSGRVLSGYIMYKAGQSLMQYIDEKYGMDKVAELLKDARDQRNIEDAIKVNFGIEIDQFNDDWRLWVKRRHYKHIKKNFDEEQAVLLSRHFKDKSFLNMHPALSPDGKKVAYLTIRDFFPSIVMRDVLNVEKKLDFSLNDDPEDFNEKTLVTSTNNNEFYQLHLLDNRLSFTRDSKNIFFCVRSKGKDHLVLFNIKKKKTIMRFTPALDMIQYPRLSYDGQMAVFIGTIAGQPDVYMLDLNSKKIKQLTDDMYSEKDPSLSYDNQTLLYSSNINSIKSKNKSPSNGDFEASSYHIYSKNIVTNKVKQLTNAPGKQLSGVFYHHNNTRRVLYSSNQTGIFNAFLLDIDASSSATEEFAKPVQITDVAGGIFEPQTNQDSKLLLYTMYRKQGYDIAISKAPKDVSDVIENPNNLDLFAQTEYPIYPGGGANIEITEYKPKFSPDWFLFGFNYSSAFGFGGFTQVRVTDYMGNHDISGYVDYLSQRDVLNFNLAYRFLKQKIDYSVGAFRAENFFSIFNLTDITTINDFFYNPGFSVESIARYGVYAKATYPFSPFLRAQLGVEFSRFEEKFRTDIDAKFRRYDIYTNINSLDLALAWNNVMYSYFGPIKGAHFVIRDEQTLNLSGNDFVYNRTTLDARYYVYLGNRYIIASRFAAGQVSGPQSNYFPFQIGGPFTVRGYDYLEFQGQKSFYSSIELRFPLLDALAFGFPVPWVMRGFSAVFFVDIGSAFNDTSSFVGKKDGRLKDLKMSYGLGTRFVLFPGILIKIDWATPWDHQSSLPIRLWQGQFTLGYEY